MQASIASRYIRHTLGAKVGGLVASPELEIINHVSRSVTRMRQWKFLLQRTAPLSLRKGEAFVELPIDFGEALSLEPTVGGAKLSWLELTTPGRLIALRSDVVVQSFTHFACVVDKPKAIRNLFLRSDDFTGGAWQNVGVTVTANSTVAPNGELKADTLSVAASASLIRQRVTSPLLLDGQTYTLSVFLKAGTSLTTDIEIAQTGPATTPETSSRAPTTRARITWAAGVASIALLSSKGNGAHDVGLEDVGDGFYRCYVSATFDLDRAKPSSEMAGVVYPSPVVASGTVIAWGAQFERTEVAGPDQIPQPERYEPVLGDSNVAVTTARRLLELWPTPTVDRLQAFRIFYRAKIGDISDAEASEIVIPAFMDDFYLEVCRIYARGYQEEDEGSLHERLESLRQSRFFLDAADYDDGQQYEFGPLSGLAVADVAMHGRDWNSGRVPYPNE